MNIHYTSFSEYYDLENIPEEGMFYSLKDSQEERKEKKLFYKSIVDSRWTFKDELQKYLNSKANALLSAILKIITNCYNIQICLRKEFPTQKMEIGSILSERSISSFFFTLMMHYSQTGNSPILSTRFCEKGIYSANTSEDEFLFQHFIRYKRPDNKLIASYLTGDGPKVFPWTSIPGEVLRDFFS